METLEHTLDLSLGHERDGMIDLKPLGEEPADVVLGQGSMEQVGDMQGKARGGDAVHWALRVPSSS